MFLDFFLRFPPLRIFLNLTFGPFPPNFLQTAALGTVMGATLVQSLKLEKDEDPILCCPAENPGWWPVGKAGPACESYLWGHLPVSSSRLKKDIAWNSYLQYDYLEHYFNSLNLPLL